MTNDEQPTAHMTALAAIAPRLTVAVRDALYDHSHRTRDGVSNPAGGRRVSLADYQARMWREKYLAVGAELLGRVLVQCDGEAAACHRMSKDSAVIAAGEAAGWHCAALAHERLAAWLRTELVEGEKKVVTE